ncbi:unnamed protein product [Symbiodinium necroappetens]|uniref:Uncharacterized protein n=1 Tax=Symbiodinium necroappetens TaxID=1628268 RepID=A0A812NQA2_9DINO|nr:unnamed protein product [Symbiodinium necroappetens]
MCKLVFSSMHGTRTRSQPTGSAACSFGPGTWSSPSSSTRRLWRLETSSRGSETTRRPSFCPSPPRLPQGRSMVTWSYGTYR